MKYLIYFCLIFPAIACAQPGERLNDLLTNQSIVNAQTRNLNNGFVYIEDTLELPIRDDFSTSKFAPYDAVSGQSNVLDSLHYLIWDLAQTGPIPLDSFATDTTFYYQFDTLSTADSIVITSKTPFSSAQYVLFDVCVYPFVFDTVEVWPPYNVFDSSAMVTGDLNDTLTLVDLMQDSAIVHIVSPTLRDTNFIWIDHYACRNSRYAINPPTVGVATFDGLNENGYPYDFTGIGSPYGEADYLTSKPINMAQHLSTPTYLSFYYQSTGLGNQPEEEDSLVLEYWVPAENDWEYIWSTRDTIGMQRDSFYYVHLELDSAKYFADGFRFRFKNFASLSGNLDHWNLDFVYLNTRAPSDSIFADVAFVYEGFGILNDYTAMPWKHYKWDPDFYTQDTTELTVYNNNTTAEDLFAGLAHMYAKFEGVALDSVAYVTGGSANVLGREQRQVIYPDINFILDTTVNDTCAIFQICHTIETDDPSFYQLNDTVRFEQNLSNYYAYDDGSAEAAYGAFGAGAMVAQKFEVQQADSIRSVMMHWAPSVEDVSQKLLRLTIWGDDGNGKPGTILYQTEPLFGESPQYSNDKNGFVEYFLKDVNGNETERLEVNGSYFVGWVQSDPDVLNVGFDRNVVKNDKIFYNASGSWFNSSFEGSLMIRPVFVSDKDGFLSDDDLMPSIDFEIYPNPTNNVINIATDDINLQLELLSISGQRLANYNSVPQTMNVSDLSPGIYMIRLYDDEGTQLIKKFIKQ